jgi:hypothetical protein
MNGIERAFVVASILASKYDNVQMTLDHLSHMILISETNNVTMDLIKEYCGLFSIMDWKSCQKLMTQASAVKLYAKPISIV